MSLVFARFIGLNLRMFLQSASRVLLFAAHSVADRRKGLSLLLEALRGLSDIENLFLLSLGNDTPTVDSPVRHLHLSGITDDRLLALVYSAADVFVIPSLQDNLPNTVMESMSCGTPVVSTAWTTTPSWPASSSTRWRSGRTVSAASSAGWT